MSGGNANSERATTGQNSKTDGNTVDRANGWLSYIVPSMQRKITKLNYDLIEECKRCKEDSNLTKSIRDELESYCRDIRREIVKKMRNGCAPLFIACKRGCVPIAEYLVTVCEADVEQRGLYEVPEDHTFHYVTPLWCAVVSGKLPMVKYLIRIGCDINATSDSGSTPVRSACFMTHVEIVQYLVEAGANIKKPNINGGTCLINSVQSPQLCLYLIKKGADVNAKDIQEKTALHYAIQEHRLETTKLLLDHGADPYVKSRYGDDAMRTACIKGANQIFDYLKTHLEYSPERMAEAHELIGSTYLDEHNETRVAILHWRLAHHIRASHTPYLQKLPMVPLRPAYGNAIEFTTLEELDNIATDVDAMRIQSLLICERILGLTHKDMLFRLTFRGASYADSLQLQRCIDLWRLLLEVRVQHYSILHFDTCYAAQTLVRLMIDLHERYLRSLDLLNRQFDLREFFGEEFEDDVGKDEHLPVFEDVMGVFRLLSGTVAEAQQLLQVRPVYRKQQENFDRILKCIAHLIYLLIGTADTIEKRKSVYYAVYDLVHTRVRSACTYDTLLHLCVSRLNVIKSGYLSDENHLNIVFPNELVVKLLLDCGMNVNAKNEAKSTALHVAVQPYNYSNRIIHLLLENGADLDQPNKSDERPFNLIAGNPINTIPLINYMNLRCMAATVISKYKIPYRNQLPKLLEKFVSQHEP